MNHPKRPALAGWAFFRLRQHLRRNPTMTTCHLETLFEKLDRVAARRPPGGPNEMFIYQLAGELERALPPEEVSAACYAAYVMLRFTMWRQNNTPAGGALAPEIEEVAR
jgi:hypothetical protein